MGKLSVLIVDDHAVVREGLRAILAADPRLQVVGEAANSVEACALSAARRPDVVIMDVSMPKMNGAEATRRVLESAPETHVVALSAHEEPPYVRKLLKAGARGYVLKRAVVQDLIRAIDVVTAGGVFLDPGLAARSASQTLPHGASLSADLSARKIEVGSMAALGHSNGNLSEK